MITIIHGDDTVASRNFYIAHKKKYSEALTVQGKSIGYEEVTKILSSSGGLFGTEIHLYIEDFFSKRKASKELDTIIEVFTANAELSDIVFWESKDLTAKQLGYVKKATVRQFKIPKTIFSFLDCLRPKNTKQMLTLYHETLMSEDAEYVFTMIVRQFRLMLAVGDTGEFIEEVVRMAPWMKIKIERQAHLFSPTILKEKYKELYEIEKAQKTSGLPYSMSQAIDFWLIGL